MKNNQDGFGIVGIILLLLVVGGLGFAGWRFYDANKTAQPSHSTKTSDSPRQYTDTANRFTFNYPATWTTAFPAKGGTDGSAEPDSDWAKVSRPVLVQPAEGQKDNNVTITPGCETVASDGKTVGVIQYIKDRKDQFHTQQDLTINGYQALYDKLDFKGDAETYLDHTYVILAGADCLQLKYRERTRHDMSGTNFDDNKNMPGFKTIVESVKFQAKAAIDSFEACKAAGNPIQESYPERCSAGGKTFTNPAQSASPTQ